MMHMLSFESMLVLVDVKYATQGVLFENRCCSLSMSLAMEWTIGFFLEIRFSQGMDFVFWNRPAEFMDEDKEAGRVMNIYDLQRAGPMRFSGMNHVMV
jgi:hypothetical protein